MALIRATSGSGGGSSHEVGSKTASLVRNTAYDTGIKADDVGMFGVRLGTQNYVIFFYNNSGSWVREGDTGVSLSVVSGYINITSAYPTQTGYLYWG